MGNCLGKVCQSRPARIPSSSLPIEAVPGSAQSMHQASQPQLPALPVLSPSARQYWRQLCNHTLNDQLVARGFLSAGNKLNFSVDERTEIRDALRQFNNPDHQAPSAAQRMPSLATACILGNPATFGALETLIRHGLLNVNEADRDGHTLLQATCLHGLDASSRIDNPVSLQQRITSLVRLGASINRRGLPAISLLQKTWERDDEDGRRAAVALIANGCFAQSRDAQGRNLAYFAAASNNMPVLRGWHAAQLAMHVSDPRDRLTASPMLAAAENGHVEAIRFLVQEGDIDVNAKYFLDNTALHTAVRNAHVEAAKALLKLGADPNTMNVPGQTPVLLAQHIHSAPILKLLIEHGGTDPDDWLT